MACSSLNYVVGFGPMGVVKISEGIGRKIPVGGVLYGGEAYQPILDLLKD